MPRPFFKHRPGPKTLMMTMLAVLAAVASCSPVDVLNAVVPGDTYKVTKDIPYGEHERLKLDVYTPLESASARPVIVFFYGGSWQFGSKDDYVFVGESFARRGYVVVIADYRVHPEVLFPEFLYDSAKAASWAKANAERYGGNAQKLYLMGHSAGAYNAVMLAIQPDYLKTAELTPDAFAGVIGLAGPYDFLPLTSSTLKEIFNQPDINITQPITFAKTAKHPRMLLITGDGDWTVAPKNTRNMTAALREGGTQVEAHYLNGVGHYRIASALSSPLGSNHLLGLIEAFIQRH